MRKREREKNRKRGHGRNEDGGRVRRRSGKESIGERR